MKIRKYPFILIAVIFMLFTGCTKDDQAVSTALRIRVIDELGNSIPGVSVKLYNALEDLEHQEKQLGSTQSSDTTGEVTFYDLQLVKYYWRAEKGCKNNINGVKTTDILELNRTRTVTSTLIETGTLELKNQSSGQYQVYVNGSLLLTADPLYECTYEYVPAGSYSINVSLVGGSTNKTYKGDITCGSKFSVTYP
jgi:hypothetical protein